MKKQCIRIFSVLLVVAVSLFMIEPYVHSMQHSDVAIAKDDKGDKDKDKKDKDNKDKKEDDKDKDKDKDEDEDDDDDRSEAEIAKDQQKRIEEEAKMHENMRAAKNDDGEVTLHVNQGNEDDVWTNYAQIIMASAVKKQKKKKKKEENKSITEKAWGAVTAPFSGKINGILGKGGVSFEEPFSKMAADSKAIDGARHPEKKKNETSGTAGRQVASYLATFSGYGYIESFSGNQAASKANTAVSKVFRTMAGGIAELGLIVYYTLHQLQDWISDFMIKVNPYQLFGFGDGGSGGVPLPDNPVTKGVNKVIDWIGLDRGLTYSLTSLGMVSIVVYFILKFLYKLPRSGHGAMQALGEMFKRLFVIVLMFTFLAIAANAIGHFLKDLRHSTNMTDNSIISHLYDSESIASGTNLSPSGGTSTDKPDVGMAENYMDKDYNPSVSRKRIAKANKNANWILYDTEKSAKGERDLAFDLVNRYMDAGNFNVNNYIADLRRSSEQTGTGAPLPGVATYPEDFKKGKHNAKQKHLEYSMWSATQNVDKDQRDPSNKNFRPSGHTGTSPGEETGVVDNSTFSTQSVVLMLQSSFDGRNAKFYAYNLGAKGEQSGLKSLSTIKTEWKSVTLPGEGMAGKFASWLGMVSQSITYTILGIAVLMAILTTNLTLSYILFFKQVIRTCLTGSINSCLATFYLFLGSSISTVIATYIPDFFVHLLPSISEFAAKALQDVMPPEFIEIIVNTLLVIFAVVIGLTWKVGGSNETLVRIACTILSRSAIAFESRVPQLDKEGATSLKNASKGMFKEGAARFSKVKDDVVKDTTGAIRTYSNAGKQSAKGAFMHAAKGAGVAAVSGNPSKIATGAAMGAYKGYKAGKQGNKYTMGEASKQASSGRGKNTSEAPAQKKKQMDARRSIRDQAIKNRNNASAEDAKKFRDKKLSKSLSVPVEDSAKGRLLTQEKKQQTARANVAAQYAQDEDGNSMFSRKELSRMHEAENMEGYINSLKDTARGNEYALNTESAKAALLDSQFVDEDGEVDLDKVEAFEEQIDNKQARNALTDEDMQEKALLDSAFASGATERYRVANSSEDKTQTPFTTPTPNKHINSASKPSRMTPPYNTTNDGSAKSMITASKTAPTKGKSKFKVPNTSQVAKTVNQAQNTASKAKDVSKNLDKTPKAKQPTQQSKPQAKVNKTQASKTTQPRNNNASKATTSKPKINKAQASKETKAKNNNITKNTTPKPKTNRSTQQRKNNTSKEPHPNGQPRIKRNRK